MTTYIVWPDSIDVEFREAYAQKVGEEIQSPPQALANGKSLTGSSRITLEQQGELSIQFPEVSFASEIPPEFQ